MGGPERADYRSRIEAPLARGDVEAALRAIERLVDEVFCEPLNAAEIFADAYLDAACQRAGAASLAAIQRGALAPGAPERGAGAVFIASRLQASGGHTAVLADVARHAAGPVHVLLTGISGSTDLDAIKATFAQVAQLHFERAPRGSRAGKLTWLQRRLLDLRPATVWLFNHHQDSVAVAAVQPGQGYQLKYLHHGDHHLCLGVYLPFGEHYDPHAMGFRNCREVLKLPGNRYLPMAIDDPGERPEADLARDGCLVTCTAAGTNKIEHAYWPAYAEVVAALLARTRGVHVHVGRLTASYRRRIRRALAREGVPRESFRYIPHVRSVAGLLRQEKVDLYLSSFPYAGARTLIEAMAAGVPIAAHDHSGKRFLSAMDMLPEGSCVWSQPSELLSFVEAGDRASLFRLGEQARTHYVNFHSPQAMGDALTGRNAAPEPAANRFEHHPDLLAQAVRRARQFSLAGLVSRWMVRAGRRLKSTLC